MTLSKTCVSACSQNVQLFWQLFKTIKNVWAGYISSFWYIMDLFAFHFALIIYTPIMALNLWRRNFYPKVFIFIDPVFANKFKYKTWKRNTVTNICRCVERGTFTPFILVTTRLLNPPFNKTHRLGFGGTLRRRKHDYLQTNQHHHHHRVSVPARSLSAQHAQRQPPRAIKTPSHQLKSTEESQPHRWVKDDRKNGEACCLLFLMPSLRNYEVSL